MCFLDQVRNGSERVVTSSREHVYDLRALENYTFTDENGKDMGINVRHRAKGTMSDLSTMSDGHR